MTSSRLTMFVRDWEGGKEKAKEEGDGTLRA